MKLNFKATRLKINSYLTIVLWLGMMGTSLISNAQSTTIQVGGVTRNMIVYSPANLGQNRPLVISLHGLNQDAPFQQSSAKWEEVADTAKFVVVYPNAINKSWDISGNRDINFLLAIIDNMKTRFNVDLNRVYVTGFSMGGMMSYHTANNIADKVAAIGPVSGYLFSNPVSSSRPMPIIHIHGTTDDVVGYNGVAGVISKWRNWNGCPSNGTLIDPYPANKPNSAGSLQRWGPCDNSEIVLISNENKGHWHSNDNAGVHSTAEIWKFFRRHSLKSSTNPSVNITTPTNNALFITPATIAIAATATDPNGTISKVEFYNGTTKLGEDVSAPYTFTWSNVPKGNYSLTAKATDNEGNATTSAVVVINVNVPQGPYNGTVHAIPGTIQFEHYDVGGNGAAYQDDSPENTGGATFRLDEAVDLENCTDAGTGYNVGFATAGEWLEYSVDVAKPGIYEMNLRVACNGDDRTINVAMDGVILANNIALPNTAGWQSWQTVKVTNLTLTPGEKIMRVTVGATDYVNLNYVTFVLTKELIQEPFNSTAHTIPGRIEAEEYDLGGEGLAYHETNAEGNQGNGTFRDDEVDIEVCTDAGGGFNLGYTLTGEWLEYTVDVANTGAYDLDLRLAKDGNDGMFHIEMDGEDITGPITVPNTGGWQVWETVTLDKINLTAGEHVMRIVFDSDYTNLNYVEFKGLVTSLSDDESQSVTIYPNPFDNHGFIIKSANDYYYSITDLRGIEVEVGSGKDNYLIGSNLTSGIYLLKIENETGTFVQKVIKR